MTTVQIDDQDYKTLKRAILITWDQIAPDALEGCDNDNECAIEVCIDANRMTMFAGDVGKEAEKILDQLLETYKYPLLLKHLSKSIHLV